MARRENPAQAVESTDASIRHNLHERASRTVEQPRTPELTALELLHDALAERAASYAPGMTVERMGRLGSAEHWTVAGVDANGSVYLVEELQDAERPGTQRRAILHGTEVALEERAATFGPTLAEAWTPVFDAKMIALPDHTAEATAAIIGKQRADILTLAAERMAANPSADPSAELLRAIDDVVAEIAAHKAEGPRAVVMGGDRIVDPATVRIFDRQKHKILTLANDESLLSHLRFGTIEEVTDESFGSVILPPGERTEVVEVKNIAMLRAEIARTLVGAPALREGLLGGLVEVDLENPRTLATIDADINVIIDDISALERAWRLHGDSDKHLPEVAAQFARMHTLRQFEKSLLAERRGALERKKQEQAHALADVQNLWIETIIAIDKRQKQEQSISLMFRRDLELGADPTNVIGALEYILSSSEFSAIPRSERRGCVTLLRSLRKQHLSEAVPNRKETASTAPETVEVEIDDEEPAVTPSKKRMSMADRFAVADAKEKAQSSTPVEAVSAPATKRGRHRAPKKIEPKYIPYPQAFPPKRDTVTELHAWADVGDRGAALTEGMAESRYTDSYRKFADMFGGPTEFNRLHAEARAKTTLVKFTLEDLRDANVIQRWLYKRQMQKAAVEMLRQEAAQEAEAKAARKRRGGLQA